jgi:hypothetical protein
MRQIVAIGALLLALVLGMVAGGARMGFHSAQLSGRAGLLASGPTPDGWGCGGSIGTPC